jgi:SAM-dependent methyltransferase
MVLWNLEQLPLPFEDSTFDEIHAYDVLEHIRSQGDFKGFFADFTEYWRILKPDGLFVASVPAWDSQWAWGDPSHKRIITPGTLAFLTQAEYAKQCGVTRMTDFRYCYEGNFETATVQKKGDSMMFVLQAKK